MFHLREKESDVQNIVTTVIIRVESDDALWGIWPGVFLHHRQGLRRKKIFMKI